jgi:uncharacterized repeat protein (TIGR01451 family)
MALSFAITATALIAVIGVTGSTLTPPLTPGLQQGGGRDPSAGDTQIGESQISPNNNIQPLEIIFNTDFVSAGFGGMRGIGTGTITVTGVNGTVSRALLFWNGPTNSSNPGANATVNFAGTAITGTNIGFSSDNCWGFANSQAYRADVTSIVLGNGVYSLSNFTKPDSEVNGVSLIVFFNDGNSANNRDVVLFDGNDSNIPNPFDANGWNVTLSGIDYTGGTANLQLHVSDGQSFPDDALRVNGQILVPAGPVFQGNSVPNGASAGATNGGLWDIRSFSITPFLTPGANTITVTTGVGGDCLSLVVAAIDLPAGAAPTNDLKVSKTASPNPVAAGQNISYTVRVENTGAESVSNVRVTDTIQPNTRFVSVSAPAGWSCTAPPVGGSGTVVCTKSIMAPNEIAIITIVVSVDCSTPNNTVIVNTVLVESTVEEGPPPFPVTDMEAVTVIDPAPRIVSCPGDIVRNADANQCSAVVDFPVPTVTDNCPGATIICVPPSGQRLDAGTSQTVTCTATDAAGNTSACSFRISVRDAQPPTIACPTTPVQINAGGACTITVPDITASVRNSISDACTPVSSLTVTQSPAPNTSVASDLRSITITVTDGAGVSTTCRVPVTVINSGGQAAQVTIGSGNELDLSVKLLSKKKSKKKVKPVVDTGTFTVKNVKCDGTSLTLPFGGVRRLTDAGAGKPINDPDDNDFFSVFIGCGASRTRLNVGQNVTIGFGEEVCFTVEFNPTIPPVASATTNLSASEVLPADFRSEVVLDGINPVVIRARVDGGVRLIDPATGSSNNPVVTICQSGNNEFTVRYHAWSPSKSDVRSVKYEFLDSSGGVIKTLDVDLAGPIAGTSLVNGQSFNIEQSFSGTGVSSVRVTLNGASSSSTATSGSISSNCPSAIQSPSQQRATLFLPGLTVDAVKP